MDRELFKHMFEIELKECYEDLYKFRDEEIELYENLKFCTKPRRAATPTKQRSESNYFFSIAKSKKTTMT